jgi:hypothetical protein
MTTDKNQRPPVNDEPLPAGSGRDRITADTPTCPTRNVQCPARTNEGCGVQVCWVQKDSSWGRRGLFRSRRQNLNGDKGNGREATRRQDRQNIHN